MIQSIGTLVQCVFTDKIGVVLDNTHITHIREIDHNFLTVMWDNNSIESLIIPEDAHQIE